MPLIHVGGGPIGFERQTFECGICDHTENVILALNPMYPNKLGWRMDEPSAPPIPDRHKSVTHKINDGVLVEKPATESGK